MKKVAISVCVPTYKRPHMVVDTIKSFLAQDVKDAEIVICDDFSNDETESVVKRYIKKDKRIRYIKNKKNLGYCRNFIKTMKAARGKYLFLLGDDDIILGYNTLQRYINIFNSYNDVSFIYSNIIQFNNNFAVDYVYTNFPENIYYKKGLLSLENIWLKSTFVGGVGLRKSKELMSFFPKDDVLFPIVELVGKSLLTHGSIGLANFSVGMRVHQDQLGFHMMRKKRVVGRERHAALELYEINDNLAQYIARHAIKVPHSIIRSIIDNFVQNMNRSTVMTEGTRVEKRVFFDTVKRTLYEEKRIKHPFSFWIQLFILLLFPQSILVILKEAYRKLLEFLFWKSEKKYFTQEVQRINL